MRVTHVINQSSVRDSSGQDVQRVVNAAPEAYDSTLDAIKTKPYSLINEKGLLRSMLYTWGRLFLYPLQEIKGSIAYDYSENAYDAQYNGCVLDKISPTPNIDRATRFVGTSYIVLPKTQCTVKNKAAITFTTIIQIIPAGVAKHVYLESVSDGGASSRFCVQLTADNKVSVLTRTGLAAQTLQTVTTTNALTAGPHIIAISLDIVAKEVLIYVDGTSVAITGTVDYGTDVAFANTDPMGYILLGSSQNAAGTSPTPNYVGIMAYAAMFNRKLTAAEILAHAKAGGFAT